MHVHVVGYSTGGARCWLRVKGWHRPMAARMLRHIGLPGDSLKGDLDRLYIEPLLELVRGSSLGAAVMLAQDDVHDERGRVLEGVGSFYVPNHYVQKLAREHKEFFCLWFRFIRRDQMCWRSWIGVCQGRGDHEVPAELGAH